MAGHGAGAAGFPFVCLADRGVAVQGVGALHRGEGRKGGQCADLRGEGGGEFALAGAQMRGHAAQGRGAFGDRQAGPGAVIEGAACGAGGCVHVGVACFGDDGCDLLGMGRHHFDLPAGGGRHPGAIDEQAVGVAQGDAFGKFKRHVRSSINV